MRRRKPARSPLLACLLCWVASAASAAQRPACAFAPGNGDSTEIERFVTVLSRRYVDSTRHFDPAGGITGVLAALGDPNTRRLSASQFKDFVRETSGSEHVGVGLVELLGIDYDRSGRKIVVVAPEERSPAERAGVRAGDTILTIDGRPVEGQELSSVAQWLRGTAGSRVDLEVKRGKRRIRLQLTRQLLTPKAAMVRSSVSGRSAGTGVIRIGGFTPSTPDSVAAALERFEVRGVKRLVIDLRENPGGDLLAARRVAGLFVGTAPIALSVSRGRADTLFGAGHAAEVADTSVSITVQIDHGTASAAELLASALHDVRRARLVGERTFGKGLVHSVFGPFCDSSMVIFTVGRLATLSGREILGNGLIPDSPAARAERPIVHRDKPPTDDHFLPRGEALLPQVGKARD